MSSWGTASKRPGSSQNGSKASARATQNGRRRFRIAVTAIRFFRFMVRKLLEIRWGESVEPWANMLLQSTTSILPPNYFSKLGACPLPPGWVSHVLPKEVLQQVLTFAKNKLVQLITPVCKLKAHRRNLAFMMGQMAANTPQVTEQTLRDASPFLDALSAASLDELLRGGGGHLRVYKANTWVSPPSGIPYSQVNGLLVLKGSLLEAPGVGDWMAVGEHGPGSMVAETRAVFDERLLTGYWAKSNVLVYEIHCRCLLAVFAAAVATKDKVRRLVAQQRIALALRRFPLTVATLRKIHFFAHFHESDLAQFAGSSSVHVGFPDEVIFPSGFTMTSVIVVLRGSVEIVPDSPDVKPFERREGEAFGEDYVVLEDRLACAVVAKRTVEYALIGASQLLATVKTSSQRKALSDDAAACREVLMQALTPLSALTSLLHADPEIGLIVDVCPGLLTAMARLATPRVFKVGDRIANIDEPVTEWYLMLSGKMSKICLTADPTADAGAATARGSSGPVSARGTYGSPTEGPKGGLMCAPCLIGEISFVKKKKWTSSLTTSRLCECWVLPRGAVMQLIRADATVAWRLQSMVANDYAKRRASANAVLSPFRRKQTTTDEDAVLAGPTLNMACDKRAAVREKQKAVRLQREAKELVEEEHEARRVHRRLAPSIGRRPNFTDYESLHPIEPAPRSAFEAVRKQEVMSPSKRPKPPRQVWMPPQAEVRHEAELMPPTPPNGPAPPAPTGLAAAEVSTRAALWPPLAKADTPLLGVSTKTQLILGRHQHRMQATRGVAASAALSVREVEGSNAFTTVKHGQAIPSMTPLGELYYKVPPTRPSSGRRQGGSSSISGSNAQPFDPRRPSEYVPVSYVSAH